MFRFGELQHYEELASDPFKAKTCDVTLEKPVIFMKLDAGAHLSSLKTCVQCLVILTRHDILLQASICSTTFVISSTSTCRSTSTTHFHRTSK